MSEDNEELSEEEIEELFSQGISGFFTKNDDEYLKFDRISVTERRHDVKDICAMLYMIEKMGVKQNIIESAGYDGMGYAIYFDFNQEDVDLLSEADVIYLMRCGVLFDWEKECLKMLA